MWVCPDPHSATACEKTGLVSQLGAAGVMIASPAITGHEIEQREIQRKSGKEEDEART